MHFSAQTIALVAYLSVVAVEAKPLAERGTSLCNQPNYGAQGLPWQKGSQPGSFCSKQKPSNSGAWANIPYSDGYDSVKCAVASNNWWSNWFNWASSSNAGSNLNVCNGGNIAKNLPVLCNPPQWGWGSNGAKTTVTAPGATTTAATTTPCKSSSTTTTTKSTSTTSVCNGVQTVTVTVDSNGKTISPAAPTTTATTQATTTPAAAPTTTTTAGTTTTNAGPAPPVATNPVCEMSYQVTYLNYTITAPNGVWVGTTVGAAAQDASYMTYTLATTVDDCLAACDKIEGCVFVNTYYDVNAQEADLPKHTPGVLTCAMFSTCVGTQKNDNFGGQDDPNTIVQSNGYCKSGKCSGTS